MEIIIRKSKSRIKKVGQSFSLFCNNKLPGNGDWFSPYFIFILFLFYFILFFYSLIFYLLFSINLLLKIMYSLKRFIRKKEK